MDISQFHQCTVSDSLTQTDLSGHCRHSLVLFIQTSCVNDCKGRSGLLLGFVGGLVYYQLHGCLLQQRQEATALLGSHAPGASHPLRPGDQPAAPDVQGPLRPHPRAEDQPGELPAVLPQERVLGGAAVPGVRLRRDQPDRRAGVHPGHRQSGAEAAKIFKSTEKEKISLLFKFFSKKGAKGVLFEQFLTMLYNYPKEDLKQILNDKDFIEYELKKHLTPVDRTEEDSNRPSTPTSHPDQTYRLESVSNLKQFLKAGPPGKKRGRDKHVFTMEDGGNDMPVHSMIGKEVMKSLNQESGRVIRIGTGDEYLDIRTINIQQLVKKFALRMFREARIDVEKGQMSFEQFYYWISTHKRLYENYYDGFHNLIWEQDERTRQPKYRLAPAEKTSLARMSAEEGAMLRVRVRLLHSVLVVEEDEPQGAVLQVICLDGLAVRKVYQVENGFGIEVSHRDGVYEEKRLYFLNEALLSEWMQLLRFYRGESVQQRYEIGDKIGTGKFSVVYRSTHVGEGLPYAIKVIETYKLDQQARNLIAHESSIMQVVSHPLLLEFKECIQTKTHIYIIMELVDGRDLFEFVKGQGCLDEHDAAKVTQQVIVGIRFLHSFEIVHRDLKPENIMVVSNEKGEVCNIKIIDFGFSNYLSKLSEISAEEKLAGTPNYIAPEVLREEAIGFRIDNFAIGVILYFMLTGALPFNDYTIPAILSNTINCKYRFPPDRPISDQARDLIEQLLQPHSESRISLEKCLEHPWFNVLKSPRSPRKPVPKKMSILG